MPRPTTAFLLAPALLAAGLGSTQATEVLLPRNDKVEAPHAGKGFGKEGSTALPVVAMAVRPVPEPAPKPTPPAPTFTGGGELGFAAASGNSNTESFNGRLDLTYTDGGAWRQARLGPNAGNDYWRQWYLPWKATRGQHDVSVRATTKDGEVQTAARALPFPDGSSGLQRIVVRVA